MYTDRECRCMCECECVCLALSVFYTFDNDNDEMLHSNGLARAHSCDLPRLDHVH